VGNTKTRRRRELAYAKAYRQSNRRQAAQRRRRQIVAGVVAGVVLLAGGGITAAVLLTGGDDETTVTASDPEALPSDLPSAEPTAEGLPAQTEATTVGSGVYSPSRPVPMPASAPDVDRTPATMVIETSAGTITAALDAEKAPCTVLALRTIAEAGFYDDTPCHRQTTSNIFVLQCGDPTGQGTGGPGFGYANENTEGVDYHRGVIAIAHSSQPDSNGSQFFINYGDPNEEGAAALAGGYTVVGEITEGLDVLDALTEPGVDDANGPGDGAPKSGAHITSLTITQGV
jgi:peptidyl-prolyl cis-trans isomerase B (cyclophilin B)